METIIDGERHELTMVEYMNGIPFVGITVQWIPKAVGGAYWRPYYWTFFTDKDSDIFKAYETGSGGILESSLNYVDASNMSFWASERMVINNPKNIPQLNQPLEFEGTGNPFDAAQIAYSYHYCRKCDADSEEICSEHLYFDDDGNIRWKGNHKYYQE